jgi:phenylpropionate dioxygenase-like ring-hydroxylating dioxygenase large terminal subunit
MAFLRNCWYVAAWADELREGLLARTILGEPLVLYRVGGRAVALLDRCPHRLLPLSKGELQDGLLQCGYHGMTFDGDGRCVRIPGQDRIPPAAHLRAYPTAEHLGMVWVWPGDPARADRSLLFDRLPQWADAQGPSPRWAWFPGPLTYVRANYQLLTENLVDPQHVAFVHKRTLGSPAMVDIPIDTKQVDDALLVTRWTPDAPASPILQRYGKWPGNVDRWQYYWLYPPHIAVVDFGAGPPGMDRSEAGRDAALRVYSAHFMTPETEGTTHYFWFILRNFGIGDAAVSADMAEQVTMTFNEDKALLEAIQAAEAEPFVTERVKLAIDAGSVRLRRTVARMIDDEVRGQVRISTSV